MDEWGNWKGMRIETLLNISIWNFSNGDKFAWSDDLL
jgi:hypothetical protein